MMANVVLMGIALPFVYVPVPVGHLAGFAAVALFAFLAMLVLIMAYRDGEAVIVAPMQYSQILWAAFYGYLIFGEAPDRATVLGAAVIIASGLYIVLRESRAKVSENRPVLTSRARSGLAVFPRGRPFRRRSAGVGAEAAEGGNEPLANPAGNR